MTIMGLDFETHSDVDIDVGAHAYAEHPSTGVHCAVLAFVSPEGGAPEVITWTPDQPVPPRAVAHLRSGGRVCAHNASFEAAILAHVLPDWPPVTPGQWVDTAAIAALCGLPVTLEGLCKSLGVPVQKDLEGHKLMKRLSKIAKPAPEDLQRLIAYCRDDVIAMLWALWYLPEPPADELELQIVDRKINTRGLHLDVGYVQDLSTMVRLRLGELNAQTCAHSEHDLVSVAKAAGPLRRHLADRGLKLDTLTRDDIVELLLRTDLPEGARELLEVRREAGRATSLAKLDRIPDMRSRDGRLRGVLRYCGAHTGRWASSGLQVHNLPKIRKGSAYDHEALRTAVRAHDLPAAKRASADVLQGLSWQLRSLISAPPGRDLIGADYSAIEARVVAWLAGQDDVLALFASGQDVYTEDARRAGSTDRQFGKVQRLGFGYGMGAVRAQEAAADYGIELTPGEAFSAVSIWRSHNAAIVSLWHDLETAAHAALVQRGTVFHVGPHLWLRADRQALRIYLPSGRALHYWRPESRNTVRKLKVVKHGLVVEREVELTELRHWVEARDRKGLAPESSYGGKLTENVTQAVARDLLAAALRRLDRTHYDVVLHVHDSVAAEVDCGLGSVTEFCALLTETPAWAESLPLAAEGYRGKHFKG